MLAADYYYYYFIFLTFIFLLGDLIEVVLNNIVPFLFIY